MWAPLRQASNCRRKVPSCLRTPRALWPIKPWRSLDRPKKGIDEGGWQPERAATKASGRNTPPTVEADGHGLEPPLLTLLLQLGRNTPAPRITQRAQRTRKDRRQRRGIWSCHRRPRPLCAPKTRSSGHVWYRHASTSAGVGMLKSRLSIVHIKAERKTRSERRQSAEK